jgi:hypothetical protein
MIAQLFYEVKFVGRGLQGFSKVALARARGGRGEQEIERVPIPL